MQTTLSFTPVPAFARLLVVAALLIAFGVLIVVVASQPRVPAPFGLARNGVVVHDAADGDIHAFDPSTGISKVLIGGPEVDVAPVYSHRGTRFVFARETGPAMHTVYVANPDGTGVRALTEALVHLNWYAWSPDDGRLAIVADGHSGPTIRVIAMDGMSDTTLDLGTVAPPVDFETTWLQWRPGGRELVFKGVDPSSGRSTHGLYLVGVDGSRLRPITPPSENNENWQLPALSPDGTQVAWSLWNRDGIGRIHVVDVDSGKVTMPVFDGVSTGDWGAVWSPDGEQLVFNRLVSGGEEGLVVAPAGGGHVVEVGPRFPAYSGGAGAEFSPDGTSMIAIYHQASGLVYLLDPAGGPGRSLSILTNLGASWQRLAP